MYIANFREETHQTDTVLSKTLVNSRTSVSTSLIAADLAEKKIIARVINYQGINIVFENPVQSTTVVLQETKSTTIVLKRVSNFHIEDPVQVGEDKDTILLTAIELIPKYSAVAYATDNKIKLASSDNIADFNGFMGIAVEEIQAGAIGLIKIGGKLIDSSWNWDSTKEIYLGLNGELVQIPPTEAVFSQEIARVITPSVIMVGGQEPIELVGG